jgi:hypothetical protein
MTWHACALARDEGEAAVYVLVDKAGLEELIPHWAVKAAAYRLSLAATRRFGPGSIVVTPLNEDSLRQALRHGHLVMLWCHGSNGAISTEDAVVTAQPLGPPPTERARCVYFYRVEKGQPVLPVKAIEIGENLQYVYCSACNAGEDAAQWNARLAPAHIVTFNRISGGLEHVFWLWFDAPALLEEIR